MFGSGELDQRGGQILDDLPRDDLGRSEVVHVLERPEPPEALEFHPLRMRLAGAMAPDKLIEVPSPQLVLL